MDAAMAYLINDLNVAIVDLRTSQMKGDKTVMEGQTKIYELLHKTTEAIVTSLENMEKRLARLEGSGQ